MPHTLRGRRRAVFEKSDRRQAGEERDLRRHVRLVGITGLERQLDKGRRRQRLQPPQAEHAREELRPIPGGSVEDGAATDARSPPTRRQPHSHAPSAGRAPRPPRRQLDRARARPARALPAAAERGDPRPPQARPAAVRLPRVPGHRRPSLCSHTTPTPALGERHRPCPVAAAPRQSACPARTSRPVPWYPAPRFSTPRPTRSDRHRHPARSAPRAPRSRSAPRYTPPPVRRRAVRRSSQREPYSRPEA